MQPTNHNNNVNKKEEKLMIKTSVASFTDSLPYLDWNPNYKKTNLTV